MTKPSGKYLLLILFLFSILAASCASRIASDYPVRPVPFTAVKLTDSFWRPRLEVNHKLTIPHVFQKIEETGRLRNFEIAAGEAQGEFCSKYPFDDSDVYKAIESAAYSLSLYPDAKLEAYIDGVIAKIAAAQEEDGYLYTARTINPKKLPVDWSGQERWSNLSMSHELYNLGHLYEAAAAWKQATGKDNLLDVAKKSFKLINRVFGPGRNRYVPGHEEIEIGLVKLYRLTGNRKYLNLAKFFIDERGRADGHKLYGEYSQDHKPVVEQTEAVGHAVRAMYLYSGVADVAALTGDKAYVAAVDSLWEDVVSKKIYLTGGIGAAGGIEGFGPAYELPNATAYCETCASIAHALWNHRMFLLHDDGKYLDVLERILYNGLLAGISLNGVQFFYPNPLESHGQHRRAPWFSCACCPPNVTRILPSIPGYIYAAKRNALYVNLFIQSEGRVKVGRDEVAVRQETHYPWTGEVKIYPLPRKAKLFTLMVRIPGWALGDPVPSDLYAYMGTDPGKPDLRINGEMMVCNPVKGFVAIRRIWEPGDVVELTLPMAVRRVVANPQVKANAGLVALERGPLVYAAEWPDNNGHVSNLVVADDVVLKPFFRDDLLKGVMVLRGEALALSEGAAKGTVRRQKQEFVAIPYSAWANRGEGEMKVWLPRTEEQARPLPQPTLASASKVTVSGQKSGVGINDLWEPAHSNDHAHPYLHWWPNKGTAEWVQYDFEKPAAVSSVEVYWFDDTGEGECRVPESWRVLCREGTDWKPVATSAAYGTAKDAWNRVPFRAVRTSGLRLEVKLQKNWSAGVLEWRVR